MNLGRIGVVVAARTRSTRLPGKALLPLQGMPMILFLLRRLAPLGRGAVVLATTDDASDAFLADVVRSEGFTVFRGAGADVVSRYVLAAEKFGFETVIRVTGDCPFVDADLLDWCIDRAAEMDAFDLATTKGRFPVGLDAELYPARVMARLDAGPLLSAADREHLTLYMYGHPDTFVVREIAPRGDWRMSAARSFTVDTRADYEAALSLASQFASPLFPVGELMAKAA